MADNYTGWKLFDKITIVAKPMFKYMWETGTSIKLDDVQGYIVDPSNKKQLASARDWGTTYNYIYEEVDGMRKCVDKEIVEPEEYTYNNKDFTLELAEAADSSCQGGKLSFWNCWVTASDGKRFLIGIAANLLLDVLKSTTVVNGVVQDKLMFARCKGGVGMLSENMDSYKDALNDEKARKNSTRGKTTKHRPGYVYETLTDQHVYVGDVYRWYEPIQEVVAQPYYPYTKCEQITGFKKLDKPVVVKFFPTYHKTYTAADYIKSFEWYNIKEKLPARKEGAKIDDLPTMEECVTHLDKSIEKRFDEVQSCKARGLYCSKYINEEVVGLSTNPDEYTLPKATRKYILECGYRIED